MGGFEELEFQLLDVIQAALGCPAMDTIMVIITRIGGGVIWGLLGAVLLFLKKYRLNGAAILGALAISALLTEFVIKLVFLRERPFEVNTDFTLVIPPPLGTSFPSSHTSISFASAVQMFKINKQCGIIACCFATLVAFSRLYLYVHFPSDVLAGTVLGIGIGTGFAAVFKAMQNKCKKK